MLAVSRAGIAIAGCRRPGVRSILQETETGRRMPAGFIRFSGRSTASAIALGVVIVLAGIFVVLSGLALLLGLAVIAAVLGVGAVLLRKITGRSGRHSPPRRTPVQLDPSLEVFPGDSGRPREESLPRTTDPSG